MAWRMNLERGRLRQGSARVTDDDCFASVAPYRTDLIASQIVDAVRFAGGWMCDRAMAGWDVTVFLPEIVDTRPLQILGVRVELRKLPAQAGTPAAATIAVCRRVYDEAGIRQHVDEAVQRGRPELMLWPCRPRPDLPWDGGHAHHRLSPAARAFKAQALHALNVSPDVQSTECFLSLRHHPDFAPVDLTFSEPDVTNCVS
jgi:hypothetical protein